MAQDFAASADGEISVQRGQQVELLDPNPGGNTEYCLVRLVNADLTITPSNEGLIPMATIKQVPNLKVSGSRTSIENEGEVWERKKTQIPSNVKLCEFTESCQCVAILKAPKSFPSVTSRILFIEHSALTTHCLIMAACLCTQ